MKSVVCPELSTAAAGSPQAPTAAVDNSEPLLTAPVSTYKSRKSVAVSVCSTGVRCAARIVLYYY